MFSKTNPPSALRLFAASVVLGLLLAACSAPTSTPTAASTATRPAPTATRPAPTAAPTVTQTPLSVAVTVNGVAKGFTSQVIAAVPPRKDAPWWEPMPQFTQLTLTGYPVANHLRTPQIFVFPVKELGVNEASAKAAADLQALLQSRQPGKELPFLPLQSSEKQILRSQIKFLDVPGGQGMRFLTQFGNGMGPVNNSQLFYTFQGLVAGGKYYVSVILPVSLPGLPASDADKSNLPAGFPNNYSQYLADTTALLEQKPANGFTPDLLALDTVIQSIEVK